MAGVLAMNYADLAWGKGRPLGTCSLTCRRVWGTRLAARSGRTLLEKGSREWAPQGEKSEAGGQIVGLKSRGGCLRLRGRISVPGKGTWASEEGSPTKGKDYPVLRPLFLGYLSSKPHKDPTLFEDWVGEASPDEEPAPRLSGR